MASKKCTGGAWMCETARRIRELSGARWGAEKAVEIVGRDGRVRELLRRAEKIAAFDEPVLILGESGVGKELLAQAVYLLGDRVGKPFVSVNCPQYLDGNLTVSELFGHRRGSFTGAVSDRKGCFETANGGVIFLDEIGDLHMSAQVLLLRALATSEFQPLGSDAVRRVDVRVVAATNRRPDSLQLGEEFRRDLFFRLRYFLLQCPPLRERDEDWRLLVDFYLKKMERRHGVAKRFSDESLRLLARHDWPGNVRELRSLVTMGYALCDRDVIEPDDFAELLGGRGEANGEGELYARVKGAEGFWETLYEPFLHRDLNRAQVRSVVGRGLREAGSYRQLLRLFHVGDEDYQKFMDFLRHHDLKP